MTNPIPLDALDVWFAKYFGVDRYQTMYGSRIDIALSSFNSYKELQRQGRAPEGYDLDNPATVACAAATETARREKWDATHGQPESDDDGN